MHDTLLQASAGVTPSPSDVALRAELRRELRRAAADAQPAGGGRAEIERRLADDGALLVFAGQQRSIAEMYCALFCGAPVLPSGAAFTALGLAAADDQLGELGWPASILDATQRCRAAALVHTAEAFGVWPGEPH